MSIAYTPRARLRPFELWRYDDATCFIEGEDSIRAGASESVQADGPQRSYGVRSLYAFQIDGGHEDKRPHVKLHYYIFRNACVWCK